MGGRWDCSKQCHRNPYLLPFEAGVARLAQMLGLPDEIRLPEPEEVAADEDAECAPDDDAPDLTGLLTPDLPGRAYDLAARATGPPG